MNGTAGEQDPNQQYLQQQAVVDPLDAAASQSPPEVALLTLEDSDEDSDAALAQMMNAYRSQQAPVPPVADAPPSSALPVPSPVVQSTPPPAPSTEAPATTPAPAAQNPQRRFRVEDSNEDKVLALMQQGVPSQMATVAVYGAQQPAAAAPPAAAVAPPVQAPPPPAAMPAADALKALADEVEALTARLTSEEVTYDEPEKLRVQAEITRKLLARQDAVAAAQAEALRAEATAEAQHAETRRQEWAHLVSQRPDWDAPNSELRKEADKIFTAMEQYRDPRLNDPNITTTVFNMAVALRGGAPVPPAAAPALPVPASAPAPVPVARLNTPGAGGSQPPIVIQESADDLEDLADTDPRAYNAKMAAYGFVSGRRP